MPPDDERREEELFNAARAIGPLQDRAAYLDQACGADPGLRRQVEELLRAHEQAGQFLKPPFAAAPPVTPGSPVRYFGDYELIEEIARGGMGVVYKARQVSLDRIVAVKMILAGHLASEAEVKRFRCEAQAVGSLCHPNIVGIYEVGEHQGQQYFSMPFVDGPSLAQLVESGQWQPEDGRPAARLMGRVARAVQHAHEAGVLHRDLKPGNILITPDGEPCVTDFGLAKRVAVDSSLTVSGHLLGTPSFMAPEQAAGKGKHSTTAADIYSLGAVLYYLLTGRPPFVADSALDALLLVLESEAVLPRTINPRVPVDLERICLRCLEKASEDRYASAGELAADLEHFLKSEPLALASKGVTRRLRTWGQRQPALVARLLGLVVCAGISETAYQIRPRGPLEEHLQVMAVLWTWGLLGLFFEWALKRPRWANTVRFLWSGVDLASLTAVLLIDRALESPLVVLFPTLVVASGFWLRVPLVLFTTGMALLGYAVLLLDAARRHVVDVPPHWHVIALVSLISTGLCVSYLVHRVGALTHFYERRPPP
jgi:eukaryotic-like serine/threonine-protein kinase